MLSLSDADPSIFQSVRFVLTDMDETLTYQGRLSACAYGALERLQAAGVKVIPVTAAPAGWCDQMARMWPVSGVIGENGGLFFQRNGDDHGLTRIFWHDDNDGRASANRLDAIRAMVLEQLPTAELADDQPFRLTSLAFALPQDPNKRAAIVTALHAAGADVTVNNLWILGWIGGYDKLAMTRRIMADQYGVDVEAERDAILYVGDSTNDAPMFRFFRHTVGVSTVVQFLPEIPVPPAWITLGPGGDGFVEVANAVIAGKDAPRESFDLVGLGAAPGM